MLTYEIEKLIGTMVLRPVLEDAVAAGYECEVHYPDADEDEEQPTGMSSSVEEILEQIFGETSSGCRTVRLYLNGAKKGWLQVEFGSAGWDFINSYSTRIEQLMTRSHSISKRLSYP